MNPNRPQFSGAAPSALLFFTLLLPIASATAQNAAPPVAPPAENAPQTPANSAPAAGSAPSTSAAGAGKTTGSDGGTGNNGTVPKEEEPPAPPSVSAGVDVYSGVSNLEGVRRFSDGFWASGASLAYPSVAYLKLHGTDDLNFKLSVGTGDLYRGSSSTVKQPVEAWAQKPVGAYTLTAGKYYVPFALQEWQYETKYGLQLQRTLGDSDFAVSANFDRIQHRPNFYLRAGRNLSETANVGLSLGAGKGLSYGSIHDRALALDASLQRGDFKLFGEAVTMQRRSSDRFNFFYSKLVYDKNPKLKPFVGYYKWNDKSGAFGDFRSLIYGATYALRPELLVEGGGAETASKTIFWVQLHLLVERKLAEGRDKKLPIVPGLARPPL